MPRTKSSNEAQYRYNQAHLKRIPLDVQKGQYEKIKAAADNAGESVNGYIKRAVADRMERDDDFGVWLAKHYGSMSAEGATQKEETDDVDDR